MAELSFEAAPAAPDSAAAAAGLPLPLIPPLPTLKKQPAETMGETAGLKEGGTEAAPEAAAEDDAESSHFSLGAPPIQHSNHGAGSGPVQESVVDRQMTLLMNRLVGLINRQR